MMNHRMLRSTKIDYECKLLTEEFPYTFTYYWKPANKVCVSTQCITLGQKYKITYHPKKFGATGDHGILFGYDTSRFQSLSQTVINFSDLVT